MSNFLTNYYANPENYRLKSYPCATCLKKTHFKRKNCVLVVCLIPKTEPQKAPVYTEGTINEQSDVADRIIRETLTAPKPLKGTPKPLKKIVKYKKATEKSQREKF